MKFKLHALVDALGRGMSPGPVYGYDRLTLWFDRTDLLVPYAELEAEARKIKRTVKTMRCHLHYQLKLEVLQPTPEFLKVLARAVGNEIGLLINYVEVACDIITPRKNLAERISRNFLGRARALHQPENVRPFKRTWYYARAWIRRRAVPGRRGLGKGVRQPRILALYSHKPSKLASPFRGAPCLHIEWRLRTAKAVRAAGIASISDLAAFDHAAFWDSSVSMLSLPSMTKQGRLIGGRAGRGVTSAALRKRARKAHRAAMVGDVIVMQHLSRKYPKLIRRARSEKFSAWASRVAQRAADRALARSSSDTHV